MSVPESYHACARGLTAAGLLFAIAFGPALTTHAQSESEATRLSAAEPDVYPRSATRAIKTQKTPQGRDVVADRLIVAFDSGVSDADLSAIHLSAAKSGAGLAHPLKLIGGKTFLVDISGAVSLDAAISAYRTDRRVRYADGDLILSSQETPNDPEFGQQWGMEKIQAPTAWNRTHGTNSVFARRIAIVDSGIAAHPDLAGKVVMSKDYTGSPSGALDMYGHGTHVAGIAAAGTNNGQGVAGAAYAAQLMNVKILEDTDGTTPTSRLASAIYWAADNGADVINLSLGSDRSCDPNIFEDIGDFGRNEVQDAINHAWERQVVVVAAAGNNGSSSAAFPGSCDHVLAVANTMSNDARNSSSNYGTWVDVTAPGTQIWSTAITGGVKCMKDLTGSNAAGWFAYCNGTSMSAPHVAGIAALVQASCHLDTNAQAVVDRITSTADPVVGTGSAWKHGRVNAASAVCFPVPDNLRTGTVTATSIQVRWDDYSPGESSFQVGHRPINGSWSTSTVGANVQSFTHTGVTPGTSYNYRVRACDSAGCSAWSPEIIATASFHKLAVQTTASQVTSTPGGIRCGLGEFDCAEFYAPGTQVQLKAPPYRDVQAGYEFVLDHWEGDCTGSGCVVTMNGPRTVKAVYAKKDLPGNPCPTTECQEP
jgi:thermitase